MAIAALVLGIVSLVVSLFSFIIGPLAIGALIMGAIGIVLAVTAMKGEKNKIGVAGLTLSIIATVFSFVLAVIWIIAIITASSTQPAALLALF